MRCHKQTPRKPLCSAPTRARWQWALRGNGRRPPGSRYHRRQQVTWRGGAQASQNVRRLRQAPAYPTQQRDRPRSATGVLVWRKRARAGGMLVWRGARAMWRGCCDVRAVMACAKSVSERWRRCAGWRERRVASSGAMLGRGGAGRARRRAARLDAAACGHGAGLAELAAGLHRLRE